MKIGLISNVRARRNVHGLPRLPEPAPGVALIHRPLEGIDGLAPALDDLAREGIDLLAINGGDGTVSTVLTRLFEARPFADLPALALLSGGTTNMNAADVGLRGKPERALERLMRRVAEEGLEPLTVDRSVLRVRYGERKLPVHGMFFGTAAICRAIVLCRRMIRQMKVQPTWAMVATLGAGLLRPVFGRGAEDPLYRGVDMTVRIGAAEGRRETQLLSFVTTLDRMILGSRPFWGREAGALHYTGIAFPPDRLWRSAYRVLWGDGDRRLSPEHYVSRNADRICFEMNCSFTVDGELFRPEPGHPVEVTAGEPVRFLRC